MIKSALKRRTTAPKQECPEHAQIPESHRFQQIYNEERYPLSVGDWVNILRGKYPNFKQDANFYKLNEKLRSKKINGYQRFLNNKTKAGTYRWQYSSNILNDFDKYYKE